MFPLDFDDRWFPKKAINPFLMRSTVSLLWAASSEFFGHPWASLDADLSNNLQEEIEERKLFRGPIDNKVSANRLQREARL